MRKSDIYYWVDLYRNEVEKEFLQAKLPEQIAKVHEYRGIIDLLKKLKKFVEGL